MMYIYIYIYIYMYMYTHVHVYTCTYQQMQTGPLTKQYLRLPEGPATLKQSFCSWYVWGSMGDQVEDV